MKVITHQRLIYISAMGLALLGYGISPVSADVGQVSADVTETKSEGKFIESKGTKATEGYAETAGQPIYDYGKGLQVGALHLKPFIDYAHEWDSNVFLDENGRRADHINRISTGAAAELPFGGGQHLLTGSYRADIEWFQRFASQNHDDHTVGAGLQLNYTSFTLAIDESFRRTVSRSGTEFTARVPRDENSVRALLEVPFARFFLESEAFDLNIDYRLPEDDVFDHHDFTIYQRVGFDITPLTQILGEYGYKNIQYSNTIAPDDRDGNAHQAALGLRGQWTEKITYQAWGGAQFREYDLESRPEFEGFIFRSAVVYNITETGTISLRGDRSPQESTFDGQSFYIRNRAELAWRQQIAERLFFNTREIFQFNEYSRESLRAGVLKVREDIVWEAGVGLEYKMPNDIISIFGEYKFRSRDSNTVNLDYDAQSISAGVRAAF